MPYLLPYLHTMSFPPKAMNGVQFSLHTTGANNVITWQCHLSNENQYHPANAWNVKKVNSSLSPKTVQDEKAGNSVPP